MLRKDPRRPQTTIALFSILFALLLASSLLPSDAAALSGRYRAAVLMDARTGEVLFAENENEPLPPASMVKMMTELIVLEHIAEGEISADDVVEVSAKASKMGGSQVYLKQGETFPVVELLKALAIHSANDAAVALAEHLSGSTDAFVELMNQRAIELGMENSEFHFVHGLPPGRNQQTDLASAYDMALLGRELSHHSEALEWAVSNHVPFRDGEFILTNPNPLVGKYRGLEGIKTGFTSRAGYCLTASAYQKGVRLISVVMGAPTNELRGVETTRLLSRGFSRYTKVPLVPAAGADADTVVTIKGGKTDSAAVTFAEELVIGVPKDRIDDLRLDLRLENKVQAPLAVGQIVGRAVAVLDGDELGAVDLLCGEEVPKGTFWDRLFH